MASLRAHNFYRARHGAPPLQLDPQVLVVMSKTKGQTFRYRFGNEPGMELLHYSWTHRSEFVMSKTKGQRFRYRFGNETKTF